jgi:hypothetical protein
MNFHKNIFTYYVINFLTILSMVGRLWVIGNQRS